ncbi:MAG: hypothetical protein E7163_03655 [Firmicutes bacterium]|nr:hypothetical protein [Bacillota bacterium]
MSNLENNIKIKLGYISGFSQEFSQFEVLRRFNNNNLNEGISWVEFTYNIPFINKDLEILLNHATIRYVVGAEIELKEFYKLLEMNCLKLILEDNFSENIKNAKSVCITRTINPGITSQQVLVIDENTKMFDSVSDLIEESINFLNRFNDLYNSDSYVIKRK